ncbi:MAG TPA: NUDIX hydrolase [Propionibacteriaceae bacterium]|nr:NUDIX hydrolase [Propionibacteriaceae bacterium]
MIILSRQDLVDISAGWEVISSTEMAKGHITTYLQDQVTTPSGDRVTREYLDHPGAVGVIAVDHEDRLALVRQYRHAARHRLIEPPAGLLDVDGEDYLLAAQRELAEEVGIAAGSWRVLVDLFMSPGMANESLRVYLAEDLSATEVPEGFVLHGEEAEMDVVWAPLEDVVDAVLAGDLHNPVLVSGVLAAWAARQRGGFHTLRPASAPWPSREAERRLR